MKLKLNTEQERKKLQPNVPIIGKGTNMGVQLGKWKYYQPLWLFIQRENIYHTKTLTNFKQQLCT